MFWLHLKFHIIFIARKNQMRFLHGSLFYPMAAVISSATSWSVLRTVRLSVTPSDSASLALTSTSMPPRNVPGRVEVIYNFMLCFIELFLNSPEQSTVCRFVPSATFSDRLAAPRPSIFIIVLTASCRLLTADSTKVSSACSHSVNWTRAYYNYVSIYWINTWLTLTIGSIPGYLEVILFRFLNLIGHCDL